MLISQSVDNLRGGVSQQPARLLKPGQAPLSNNVLVRYPEGIRKRPPTVEVGQMDASETGYDTAFVHNVNRDTTVRYSVVVVNGTLKVFDLITAATYTVIFPNGQAYLTSTLGFRAVTVGDYTFLVNKDTTVTKGTTKAAAATPSALLFVRQADYGTAYGVTLNDLEVTIRTADAGNASSRAQIDTTNIAADLKTALEANTQIAADFDFEQYGSTLYVARTDAKDFTITSKDGLADKGLRCIKGQVQAMEDLPARAKNGMVLEVAGDPGSSKDNYWVKYEDTATGSQAGLWRECPKPGTIIDLKATTMPWALVRRGDVVGETAHTGQPPLPKIVSGADTTYVDGFTLNAGGGGGPYDGDTDLAITEHALGYRSALTSALGTTLNNLKVNYDVDTTLMDPGEMLEVRLSTDASGSLATLASKYYSSGKLSKDELFDEDLTIPTGMLVEVTAHYSTKATPSSVYKRAKVMMHRSAHPSGYPGVRSIKVKTKRVLFNATQLYPIGTVITVTLNGAHAFATTIAGTDKTGAQVATTLATAIDAHADYAATNPASGEISITQAAVGIIGAAVTVSLTNTTTFWNSSLAMIADEHVGRTIKNLTDGSSGTITANGVTHVVVGALTGGVNNTFTEGDLCTIVSTGTYFVFGTVPWEQRGVGDLELCPFPSFTDKTINEVFFNQNRLGFVSGENIVTSASGDFFRLFRKTVTDLLPDDPIDVSSAHAEVANFDSAVPWDGGVMLYSSAGHQFEFRGDPVLTPTTARIDHVGSFPAKGSVRPIPMGTSMLHSADSSSYSRITEVWRNKDGRLDGEDTTKEIPKFLTGTTVDMAGDAGLGLLFVLATDGGSQKSLWVYSIFDENGERKMEAWGKWTFFNKILAIDVNGGQLSLVVQRSAFGIYLHRIDLSNVLAADSVHQDANAKTYVMEHAIPEIFLRDREGAPKTQGRLQVRYLSVHYHDTCNFIVLVGAGGGRVAKTYRFTSATPASGTFRVPVLCDSREVSISITNDGSGGYDKGSAFSGYDWEGYFTSRSALK